MSTEVAKYSVIDPRIVQQPPTYAVEKGSLSLTNSKQTAIANSSSQQSYNIQVPSENIFVDRAVDWNCTVNLAVTTSIPVNTAEGSPFFTIGGDWSLAYFPLHQLVSTMSATINDATVTVNTSDVLAQILRLADLRDTRRQRTCPTMLDKYVTYPSPAEASNTPINSFDLSFATDQVPNGAWGQVRYFTNSTFTTPLTNGVTTGDTFFVGVGGNSSGYGTQLTVSAAGETAESPRAVTLYVQFSSCEKLVLPPFIFGDEYELSTGLFGVQNIQLLMNLQAPSRVLRTSGTFGAVSVAYATTPFPQSVVNVQFLTPSLDVPLPPKSIVPYMEFPRYITTNLGSIAGTSVGAVSSNTITLPNIPDYLYIYAKPQTYANTTQGDWVLPFQSISVNFDNFSGLLSSHTQQELYKMSVNNGLDLDWNSWQGYGIGGSVTGAAVGDQLVGGGLLLRPSRDIVLQAGQSPSLVGNFTFQFNAQVYNPSSSTVTPFIYVVAISSGFFETIKGSSRIIKGILTEQDILSAPSIAPVVSDKSLQRLVGEGHRRPAMHSGRRAAPQSSMSKYM
jgi:hypothetical protein